MVHSKTRNNLNVVRSLKQIRFETFPFNLLKLFSFRHDWGNSFHNRIHFSPGFRNVQEHFICGSEGFCGLFETNEITHAGASPLIIRKVKQIILNSTVALIGNQWSLLNTGGMWSYFGVNVTGRAAMFWILCSCFSLF